MKIMKELFNDPINFFKKKRNFMPGFLYMLAAMFVFVTMNLSLAELGVVRLEFSSDPLTVFIVNYGTLVAGYFVITGLCCIPFKLLGGKHAKDLYTIVAYSLIPMVLLWIPHVIPQAIIVVLIVTLITRGAALYAKARNRKALIVTAVFFALTVAFSLLTRNYILPYV